MIPPTSFGRRQSATPIDLMPAPAPDQPASPFDLSPEAEAFRAELAREAKQERDGFTRWRQGQDRQRLVEWAITLGFLSPGLLGFLVHAPPGLAATLEAAGVGAAIWVRYRRRRRLSEIVAWEDPAEQT